MTDRARAERLDANDPLASFRDRFVIDDPETIYLDGNSLGRLPVATRERLSELTAQWGSELVGGWHDWIDLPERVGDLLASGVLGARPGEVIVADSTTVNLFKLAGAVLDTRPGAIVTDAENFPTDRYVLDGLARLHDRELRIFEADEVAGPQPEDVEARMRGRRRRARRRSPTWPTVPARSRTSSGSTKPPPRLRCSGTSRTPWAPFRSSWSSEGWSWPWAAPTST